MKTLPLALLAALFTLAAPHTLSALSPGDCMVVGYDASSPDSVSFVTWVELAPGEQITILDAEYDGGGNGRGEGTSGGTYNSNFDTMVWTNSTGSSFAPGTVIVVGDDDSANIGSASGDLPLNAGGEQFFLVQGTLNNSDHFIGDLLFGVDFENGTSWGESGESELPGALNTTNGNLILGPRFHGRCLRIPALFETAGKYLDVIGINYYHAWTPDPERMTMWEESASKPFLITEFYAKAADSGLANTSGAGWFVKTQADRAAFYQNFTLGLLESRSCVGWHWFRYSDNDPKEGSDPSNLDANKGIVTNRYQPYTVLLDAMRELNARTHGLIKYFDQGKSGE